MGRLVYSGHAQGRGTVFTLFLRKDRHSAGRPGREPDGTCAVHHRVVEQHPNVGRWQGVVRQGSQLHVGRGWVATRCGPTSLGGDRTNLRVNVSPDKGKPAAKRVRQ